MSEVRWINNLTGTLCYLDTPLLFFNIKDRKLTESRMLNDGRFLPPELALYGVGYGNINEFFCRRTMPENCMMYREHLDNIGMTKFDFDDYIKNNNGNNNLDNYWVKFDGFGAKCFDDL